MSGSYFFNLAFPAINYLKRYLQMLLLTKSIKHLRDIDNH